VRIETLGMRRQVVLSSVVSVAILAAVGVSAAFSMTALSRVATAALDVHLPAQEAFAALRLSMASIDGAAGKLLNSRLSEAALRRQLLDRFRQDLARLDDASARLEHTLTSPALRAVWGELVPVRDAWRSSAEASSVTRSSGTS